MGSKLLRQLKKNNSAIRRNLKTPIPILGEAAPLLYIHLEETLTLDIKKYSQHI